MSKRERTVLTILLILLDGTAFVLALLLAYYVRIGSGLLPYGYPHGFARDYLRMIVVAVPIFSVICANARLYDPQQLLGGAQEYAHVVRACTFAVVALIVLSFYEREGMLSRTWLLLSWAFSIILVGTCRFLFRRLVFRLRRRDIFVTRALVVGANEQAKAIVRQLHASEIRGVRVVGFLDDYLPPGTEVVAGLEVLGPPTVLDRLTKDTGAKSVIVMPDALAWESFQTIIREAASRRNGLELKLSPGFYEILTTGVKVDHSTFVPLLTVDRVRITGIDAILKNLLDYGLGLVTLVVTLPIMAVVALAVWRVQGRPILDRHQVYGLGGKAFPTLKFRTGLLGSARRSLAHELPAKLNGASDVTSLGIFLFRTGLDKLPQLFNVLRGQMSLVGPRSISDTNSTVYGPWLFSMLTVKPGITGPWAVNRVPTLQDEIRATLYYIRNWTIWLDFQILFWTLRRMVRWGRHRADAADTEPGPEEAGNAKEWLVTQSATVEGIGEEWT